MNTFCFVSPRRSAYRTLLITLVALPPAIPATYGQEYREGVCSPLDVTAYKDKVQLRCTNEVRDGMQSVRVFGVAATESEFANRFLVQANMALTAGRPLRIQFQSRSWSQPPDIGCDSTDCRAAVAIGMF
jgi:hypothetical protein